MKTIQVEMIHDITCSWCPIGYRNFVTAVENVREKLAERDTQVSIRFLPFQLNPGMSDAGEKIETHLMERYQWSHQQLMDYRKRLIGVAEETGLTYDFSKRTHYYNTEKAHRLMHFAEAQGKQVALHEALIDAYFTEGVNVSDANQLVTLAEAVGLNTEGLMDELNAQARSNALKAKYQRVGRQSVKSVPAFIIDGNQFISGSNSVVFFERYLSELIVIQQVPEVVNEVS
ncbi:DsbA family oxidoreductase [Litoribacillus peritrichatus]|uniref:DsbA family oxidoreductase n=1 Tax=Litoribacillus peritrichatus TaxID=718191 RepID=A0ABP7MS56_9GAMM